MSESGEGSMCSQYKCPICSLVLRSWFSMLHSRYLFKSEVVSGGEIKEGHTLKSRGVTGSLAKNQKKRTPRECFIGFESFRAGVGGHPGVFSIFLDRAPRFFLRIFTGNFWIFLRTRCPLPKYVLGFPFSGVFFWPFSGFPSFYPHCHGFILKKMGKFLADTRFGHYHQRVA